MLKSNMPKDNPVVATYVSYIHIYGMPSDSYKDFNKGWGFAQGEVNKRDRNDNLIPLPGTEDNDFQKAFFNACRSTTFQVKVEILKNGDKRTTLLEPAQFPTKKPRRKPSSL